MVTQVNNGNLGNVRNNHASLKQINQPPTQLQSQTPIPINNMQKTHVKQNMTTELNQQMMVNNIQTTKLQGNIPKQDIQKQDIQKQKQGIQKQGIQKQNIQKQTIPKQEIFQPRP